MEYASTEKLDRIFEEVKNWGRWGADDQRGALNLITDERRQAAAALVATGKPVSLARLIESDPMHDNLTSQARVPAVQHMMIASADALDTHGLPGYTVTYDWYGIAPHSLGVTHIDAFAHTFHRGLSYNGRGPEIVPSIGALQNSIDAAAGGGISGRGVLLDIPRARGVEWLDSGDAITPDELEEAERAQNVRVGVGDLLIVGTGRDRRKAKSAAYDPVGNLAGLHPDCIPWMRERDIAVIGSDGISDPQPINEAHMWPLPVHQCCLVAMGVHLLDNLYLAPLAEECAAQQRWEFLLTIAPLRLDRGTGSPINPIALF